MVATALTALCVMSVVTLLGAEFKHHALVRALSKTLASVAFMGVALSLGATASSYGHWVLLALVLCLLGDVLLLSDHEAAFLAGLGAFLLAHAAFAAAFWLAGVATPVVGMSLGVASLLGVGVLRWLWPKLGPSFRGPVVAYVVVILAMCCLAVGHASLSGRWLVALGALVFAVSDLAVARDKFIASTFTNKAWGLPAYYLAQLLLAWSVLGTHKPMLG